MKSWIRHIIILAAVAGFFGTLVMVTGIMPIGASTGHWGITSWILSFSMKRSISTYAKSVNDPPQFEEWMMIKGAGHYEIGCRQCHGRPGIDNFLFQQMTPPAPRLGKNIRKWNDKELFQIVKHGVKFTAMPAWPQRQRDDEVWAVIAFLKRLPDMKPEEYERLVFAETNEANLKYCANCHGVDGNSRGNKAFPKLAGQHFDYLKNSLLSYSKHERPSGIMEVAVSSLRSDMIEALSRHFSNQKRTPMPLPETFADSIRRGKSIAERGVPEDKVASCVSCHGPFKKNQLINPNYPILAAQPAEYLTLQMQLFKKGKRGGTKFSRIMHKSISTMNEQDISDVARYYQALSP